MGIILDKELWKQFEEDIKKLSNEECRKVLLFLKGYMESSLPSGRDGYCAFGEGLETAIIEYRDLKKVDKNE